jgi:thioester reductase-like protein
MTCLITGASGFIGSRLLRPSDRALVRKFEGMHGSIAGDLLDLRSLEIACKGMQTVIHCAGYAHAFTASDANAHWKINFKGTCNILKASAKSGVKHFIFLSSVKAMADPHDSCVDASWRETSRCAHHPDENAIEVRFHLLRLHQCSAQFRVAPQTNATLHCQMPHPMIAERNQLVWQHKLLGAQNTCNSTCTTCLTF